MKRPFWQAACVFLASRVEIRTPWVVLPVTLTPAARVCARNDTPPVRRAQVLTRVLDALLAAVAVLLADFQKTIGRLRRLRAPPGRRSTRCRTRPSGHEPGNSAASAPRHARLALKWCSQKCDG